MSHRAVLLELLAVIGRHRDDRSPCQALPSQAVHEPADLRVRVSDFAVVEIHQMLAILGRQVHLRIDITREALIASGDAPPVDPAKAGVIGRRRIVVPMGVEVVHQ